MKEGRKDEEGERKSREGMSEIRKEEEKRN